MASDKRLKKVAITEGISGKLDNAKSVVITDYRGLNTAQLLELRQSLADVAAEYQITKNTLLKRVLRSKGFVVNDEALSGPTAILISNGDEIAPLKTLMKFIKKAQLPVVKAGYVGKDALGAQQVETLSKLPPREVLIGQVIGTLQAPLTGMVGVLQANMRNLVYALNAIKEKQEQA